MTNTRRLQVPPTYDPWQPKPLVVWCHNASGTALNVQDDPRMQVLMTALYEAGYPVVSVTTGQTWFNDTQRGAYIAAAEWATTQLATSGVVMVGNSMGGGCVLEILARNEMPNVLAALIIAPAVSLAELYANGTYKPYIRTAYEFTTDAEYAAATAGHDPAQKAGYEFNGIPLMAVHSPGDTVCSIEYTAELVARVEDYAPAVLITSSGAHMATEQFTDAVTYGLPFLAQYA